MASLRNLLSFRAYRHGPPSSGRHAGLVIVGILAADEIAGVPGMFLAVPFLAAMKVVLEHVRRNRSAAADEKGGPRPASVRR